jgi:uncharacterized protein (TIGR04255 family)
MGKPKLKNAPLQEVIFELRWLLAVENGILHDPEYQLAQGLFASKIKEDFPVKKMLIPQGRSSGSFPGLPSYQFWKDELTWPVVQFGEGILTVNDTEKNYVWADNFLPCIKKALEILGQSYENFPVITFVKLEYIDAVQYDVDKYDLVDFVAENLNTTLVRNYPIQGKQKGLNIVQTFDLENNSVLKLNIQNGVYNKTGAPAVIWSTSVESVFDFEKNDIVNWLDFAHQITSDSFVKMLKPDFYASFDS